MGAFQGWFGYATLENATSPTVTPSVLQSVKVLHLPLAACQPTEPYKYIDGTTRGYVGNLIYETEIVLFPAEFFFSNATGQSRSRNVDVWCYHEPKFYKSTDPTWLDRFGSGWIQVTLMSKYSLEKSAGQQQYKFTVQASSPIAMLS